MRIRLLTCLGALVVLLATAVPALAIVGGEPDNGAHPYVAAISNGSTICTGAAISSTVLVTAAHCFDFPTQAVRVIFDENFRSPTRTLQPGTWYAHPAVLPDLRPGARGTAAHIRPDPTRFGRLRDRGGAERPHECCRPRVRGRGPCDRVEDRGIARVVDLGRRDARNVVGAPQRVLELNDP